MIRFRITILQRVSYATPSGFYLKNMLKLSIYSIVFDYKEMFYLYNSRTNFFSEISANLFFALKNNRLEELPQTIIDELLLKKILVEKDSEFDYYYSELLKFNARNHDNKMLNLVIVPTTFCNFDCPYCFEPKAFPKTMTDNTIRDLIEFVKKHKDTKELNITWYGGEPLLAFDKITKIHNQLAKNDLPPIKSHSIITNGYCFNDEVIDFFQSRNLDNIQITFDGIKERHDKTRCIRKSKAPTFDKILINLQNIALKLPNTRVDIRVNINKSNYLDFVQIYKLIRELFPNNKLINAYPGIIREESIDKMSLCTNSYKPSELIDLYRLIESAGVKTYIFPRLKNKGCMMHSLNSYIIGPEGEIYKCWNDVSDPNKVVGNISSSELCGSSRFIKYTTQSVPFSDECKNCVVFPICDGGCSFHRYKNLFEGCKYELCSPYKDIDKLKLALLSDEISKS